MSKKFNWYAEEEGIWDNQPLLTEKVETRSIRWRPFLLIGLALLVAVAIVYRQVQQRVGEAALAVEADVLATHRLVQQAGSRADVELLRTMLSGRDSSWVEAQEALVEAQLFFRPTPFGFEPLPAQAEEEPGGTTVMLAPHLGAAEVQFEQSYMVQTSSLSRETVTLRQTAVYRQGNQRWLLSPPEREFWGQWASSRGGRLVLSYPQRDGVIAEQLAADLENTLEQMCRKLDGLHCPADLQVHLRLETAPESLLAAAEFPAMMGGNLLLEVPTPTLVGLPVDEAAYRALYRGYAAHLVSAVVTALTGYECCQQRLLYQALLDSQLDQLGLRPWPLTSAVYEELLQDLYTQPSLRQWSESLMGARLVKWQEVYALVDFLVREEASQMPVAEMQRRLAGGSTDDGRVRFISTSDDPFFATRLLRFVYKQSTSGHAAPPVPLPRQPVQLVCGDVEGRGMSLFQLDLQTGSWTQLFSQEQAHDRITDVLSIPGNRGYLLQTEMQLIWQRGEKEIVVYERPLNRPPSSGYYITGLDPSGRYVIITTFYFSDEPTVYERWLLDLDRCEENSCQLQSIPGWYSWSPDGSQAIVPVQPDDFDSNNLYEAWRYGLYRGDERDQGSRPDTLRVVGRGGWPTWLDNERYTYVRLGKTGAGGRWELELVVARAEDDEPQVLLQDTDLLAAFPGEGRPEQVLPTSASPYPTDENKLLVMATSVPVGSSQRSNAPLYYFLVELDEAGSSVRDISLLYRSEDPGDLVPSPDGRWLAVTRYQNTTSNLLLYNVETDETTAVDSAGFFVQVDWSAESGWLLINQGNNRISLLEPTSGYRLPIFHDFPFCGRVHFQQPVD